MIDIVGEQEVNTAAPAHVMIKVTNRNPFVLRDRFNGVPVEFPPGKTVTVSPIEANHFFGYPGTPEEMAVHMAKRFGWNTIEHVQKDGDAWDSPKLYERYAWNVKLESEEFVLVPKGSLKADDGLDVENLPVEAGHPGAPPPGDVGTAKVGQREGSPVTLRRPGRRRKDHAAADPSFTPLG